MKNKFPLVIFLLSFVFVSPNPGNSFLKNEKKMTPYEFYLTTTLFQNSNNDVQTVLKPDSDSSALKLTKEELGRYTWSFLHSVAAALPQEKSEFHSMHFTNLLNAVAALFPCPDCAQHFTKLLASYQKPEDYSRKNSIKYMCNLHNEVNKRLNKPIFPCEKASEYWGGDCGCSAKKE